MQKNTEAILLETLREIAQSNQQLSNTMKTAIDFAEKRQLNYESILPIALEIIESLSQKDDWTATERRWYTGLKSALAIPDENPEEE